MCKEFRNFKFRIFATPNQNPCYMPGMPVTDIKFGSMPNANTQLPRKIASQKKNEYAVVKNYSLNIVYTATALNNVYLTLFLN